jgi:hypothetical protein
MGFNFFETTSYSKKTIELIVDNIKNNNYPNNIHKTTGPSVYSAAINEIHMQLFDNIINHKIINKTTDITYKQNNISYRLYGIDYTNYFSFKHNLTDLLYNGKKHWRIEEKEQNLLKTTFYNVKEYNAMFYVV